MMAVPSSSDVIAWSTAIATIILLVRQQINASAGKQRGEQMQATVDGTKDKVNDIHQQSTNGQVSILQTRAVALRALATLRNNQAADVAAAQQAERDLAAYIAAMPKT